MNYTINDTITSEEPLIQFWDNTFVLYDNFDFCHFSFVYLKNDILFNISKTIYAVNDITKFIPENFNQCQINYCSLNDFVKSNIELNQCFKDFILNPIKFDKIINTEIYYSLYSFKKNETNKINLSSSNIIELNESESNDNYILQVLRKDEIDEEPFVIFQKEIILSDFIYENNSINYVYENNTEKVTINYYSLCEVKEKISLGDSNFECYYNYIKDKKECSFTLGVNSETKFDFKYDIYTIDSITLDKINYTVNVGSQNGKAKFNINISYPHSSMDIKNITIIDSINESNKIILNEEEIIFENNNNAYIEIPVYRLAKKIRLFSIGLSNGKVENVTDIYEYEFNTTRAISPEYIYSYNKLDSHILYIDSDLEKDYLSHKDSMMTSPISKNSSCPPIEFGLDYYVNFYDDVILHTIRYELETQCQTIINKNNIKFKIYSESEYPNIEDVEVKLYNKETDEFIIDINYDNKSIENDLNVYSFIINTESLEIDDYYVMFGSQNFSEYLLSIKKTKDSSNILGDIYTNQTNQHFILEFNETFNESNYINNIYISNETNQFKAICDLMLDNNNSILCKIENSIPTKGNYNLKYMDICGDLININRNLEVKEKLNPIPIENNYKYDINSNNNLIINFASDLNDSNNSNIIESIQLIKTYSIFSNETNVNFSSLNKEANKTTLNITIPSNIELGNYIIKFTYINNDVIIIPKVIIYDKEFKIKDNIFFISTDIVNLNETYISFEGKYHHNQIKKIYLIEDNSDFKGNKEDITSISFFDDNTNSLRFNSTKQINNKGQYHIEMEGDIQTFLYYFHYIGYVTNETLKINGLSINLAKKNNIIQITNNYSIYLLNLIKSITSNNII